MLNAKVQNHEDGTLSPLGVECGPAVAGPLYPIGDLSPKTSATGCHGGMPWGDYDGFLRLVSDRARGEYSESGCGFVFQDFGDEWVMPSDCPEIGAGVGGGGRGVKAVEGNRTPCPGGITACLQNNGPLWRLWRGVSEEEGEWVGMWKSLESRGGFGWQNAAGEWVMPLDCPEFSGGSILESSGLAATPCIQTTRGGEDGIVTGTGHFFRPYGTGAEALSSTHRWKQWAIIGRPCGTSAAGTFPIIPERGKTPELPEWVWTAISQGAGNEVVTCEENVNGRVGVGGTSDLTPSPSSVADYCGGWTLSRSGEGEFSAASARCGSLGLSCGDLSPKTSATGCHGGMPWGANDGFLRLVSDRAPSEYSESECGFVLHDAGDEWVMPQDCPEYSRRAGPACGTAARRPARNETPPTILSVGDGDRSRPMVTCVENANGRVGLRTDAEAGCPGRPMEYPHQRYRVWDTFITDRELFRAGSLTLDSGWPPASRDHAIPRRRGLWCPRLMRTGNRDTFRPCSPTRSPASRGIRHEN